MWARAFRARVQRREGAVISTGFFVSGTSEDFGPRQVDLERRRPCASRGRRDLRATRYRSPDRRIIQILERVTALAK